MDSMEVVKQSKFGFSLHIQLHKLSNEDLINM